jgi:hypothetical protein
MILWIILAIWIIGMVVAFFMVKNLETDIFVKIAEVLLWPMTLVLYLIYWIHKKC